MKTFLKIISSLLLILLVSILTYLFYLYIQNPVVVSRLGVAIMGDTPGIPEVVKSNYAYPINKATVKTISDDSIQSAKEYSQETGSHALLIYHKKALVLEHYFPGYSKQHLTGTASMHKSVLAVLIGIAIDQGFISSVDQSASDFLTEWANDQRSKITIRQMLQQSSGIDYPEFSFNPLGEWNEMV